MSLPLSKNWSSLLLPFVAGAIIAALAFSLFGGASDQSASSDLQGDVRKGTLEINPNATGLACGKTNCDLMAKLNQMHGNGGNSTATLHGLFLEGEQNTEQLQNQIWGIRGVDSSGNVSSWTLNSLAIADANRLDRNLQEIWNVRGPAGNGISSWNLENLAIQNFDMFENTVGMIKNNGMGPSSWTLQALASQIANVCQN